MGAHPSSAISPRFHILVHQLAHRALGIRTRYPNERHNFFGGRISAPKRAAVQGTYQRTVPISRPFFHSTKSATLQFCSVALSFKWVSCAPMNSS